MSEDPRDFFFRHALQNAVLHDNVPKEGSVLGAFLSQNPEYRTKAKEILPLLREVLQEVSALSAGERRKWIEENAPELLHKEKKERETGLPPLTGALEGGVVMRFAPNPSGPLHLGHARAAYLNDWYVRRYKGRYILRIEDTDPRRVEEENYQLLLDDIEWLDLAITETVYQSDRLQLYYDNCEELIRRGGAYVCTCESEHFRDLKNSGQECPCRTQAIEDTLSLWEDMLNGKFCEGMASVRLRTDLLHPDPAMRDFPIFRIVDSPIHPRCDARVYPLMNFSVVVDDHLLGITHVIRGKDHIANTRRQRYIYDYFGWKPPEFSHYGRMSIGGVVLSTSAMKQGIANGVYSGWDDIHLGTLGALARRGFLAEAVRNAMIDIGTGQTDISFSWENLYAQNRVLVDPDAERYFFVPEPVVCSITDAPQRTARIPLHPGNVEKGLRSLTFSGELFAPKEEVEGIVRLRFKDLFNVERPEDSQGPVFIYAGDSLEETRKHRMPIVQWLPHDSAFPCILHTPEGDLSGMCEPGVVSALGRVVQFERVGFARIDAADESGISAYFAHK